VPNISHALQADLMRIKKIEDSLFLQLMEGAKDNIKAGKAYPSMSFTCWMLLNSKTKMMKALFGTYFLVKTKINRMKWRYPIMLHVALVLLRKLIISLVTATSFILTTTRDTRWYITLGFIKAMILYPEVQAEAQREISRVVDSDRLPVWEDRENLPYIRGVVEESLRCIQSLANF
jgi:Cytochrome P450